MSEETDWHSGLFNCWDDKKLAAMVSGVGPVLPAPSQKKLDQNRWLPICDMCSPAMMSSFGIPLFVAPAALALRISIRQKYKIKGSLFKDIATSCACVLCSWCQLHRELKVRKPDPAVVNMQPTRR